MRIWGRSSGRPRRLAHVPTGAVEWKRVAGPRRYSSDMTKTEMIQRIEALERRVAELEKPMTQPWQALWPALSGAVDYAAFHARPAVRSPRQLP